MKRFPSVPSDLTNAILNCKRAIVCGHLNPDGDCANSVMSMGLLLKALGKKYILVNEGNFERPEIEEFGRIVAKEIPKSWLNKSTLGIVVDCSTPDRLGVYQDAYSKLDIAVIDHHASGTEFGHYRYVVPQSISTTLLIYNVFKACKVELSEEVAHLIFRGFATDSGFFKFLGTGSAPTFRIIADLAEYNVAPNMEFHNVNGNKPLGSVFFLAEAIKRTESLMNGRLMITHEEPKDKSTFGDDARASDDYYAQMLSVKGVEVVLFFKQSSKVKGAIEVGMRASHNSSVNVGALASSFGGGGHAKAAGCTIKGSFKEVKEKVLNAIRPCFN